MKSTFRAIVFNRFKEYNSHCGPDGWSGPYFLKKKGNYSLYRHRYFYISTGQNKDHPTFHFLKSFEKIPNAEEMRDSKAGKTCVFDISITSIDGNQTTIHYSSLPAHNFPETYVLSKPDAKQLDVPYSNNFRNPSKIIEKLKFLPRDYDSLHSLYTTHRDEVAQIKDAIKEYEKPVVPRDDGNVVRGVVVGDRTFSYNKYGKLDDPGQAAKTLESLDAQQQSKLREQRRKLSTKTKDTDFWNETLAPKLSESSYSYFTEYLGLLNDHNGDGTQIYQQVLRSCWREQQLRTFESRAQGAKQAAKAVADSAAAQEQVEASASRLRHDALAQEQELREQGGLGEDQITQLVDNGTKKPAQPAAAEQRMAGADAAREQEEAAALLLQQRRTAPDIMMYAPKSGAPVSSEEVTAELDEPPRMRNLDDGPEDE